MRIWAIVWSQLARYFTLAWFIEILWKNENTILLLLIIFIISHRTLIVFGYQQMLVKAGNHSKYVLFLWMWLDPQNVARIQWPATILQFVANIWKIFLVDKFVPQINLTTILQFVANIWKNSLVDKFRDNIRRIGTCN